MKTAAYFENIQYAIAAELKEAKQTIYAAVAWFTDFELFYILCDRASKGVEIKIIVQEDEINSVIDFSQVGINTAYLKTEGEAMHHKFCVIDSNIVITGSYNWTNQAQFNHENIVIIKGDKDLSDSYTSVFLKLHSKYSTTKISLTEKLNAVEELNIDKDALAALLK